MADRPETHLSEFTSKAYSQRRKRKSNSVAMTVAPKRPVKKTEQGDAATSLISVMATAVVACMIMLAFALSGTSVISNASRSVKEVLQSDMPLDEALGKLKFVSENIASVFGITRSAFILPVEGAKLAEPFNDETGSIELIADSGADVVTSASGTVKMVTTKESGQTVLIDHGGGTTMNYDNLTGVCVEEGQPLRQGDAIGRVAVGGNLTVSLMQDGSPRDISALLGLS